MSPTTALSLAFQQDSLQDSWQGFTDLERSLICKGCSELGGSGEMLRSEGLNPVRAGP